VRYIGVDPGVSGGLAAINENGKLFGALRMPEDDDGFLEAIEILSDGGKPAVAALELVSAGLYRGKVGRMGVTSAFTFGGAWRGIRVALRAWKVEVIDVRPVQWQTALNCRTGGDKKVSKAFAEALFPDMHVTLATADALLLAEWCRRTRGRR
jgi:membrane-associated phospholipid phosphatase